MHNSQWCTPWGFSWSLTSTRQHPKVAQASQVMAQAFCPLKPSALIKLFNICRGPQFGLTVCLSAGFTEPWMLCPIDSATIRRKLARWTAQLNTGSLVENKENDLCLEAVWKLLREKCPWRWLLSGAESACRVLGGEAGHLRSASPSYHSLTHVLGVSPGIATTLHCKCHPCSDTRSCCKHSRGVSCFPFEQLKQI